MSDSPPREEDKNQKLQRTINTAVNVNAAKKTFIESTEKESKVTAKSTPSMGPWEKAKEKYENILELEKPSSFLQKVQIPLYFALFGFTSYAVGRFSFGILWPLLIIYVFLFVFARRMQRYRDSLTGEILREAGKEKAKKSVEWLNLVIQRFWTSFEPNLSASIVESVNSVLEASTPGFIQSIRLTEFTLGSEAPVILGAQAFPQTDSDIIHLEMELLFVPIEIAEDASVFIRKTSGYQWNSKIVLAARFGASLVGVGVDIPILLKGISFKGKLRVQMKLTSTLPIIKIVEISFTEHPKIDFILKPLKSLDLMDLPGLSNWLHSLINGILASQLVNPNMLTINLEKGMKSSEDNVGVIKVTVYQVALKAEENVNAYVQIETSGKLIGQTAALEEQKPYYNETFYFIVSSLTDFVQFTCFVSTALVKDKENGTADFWLSDLNRFPLNRNLWLQLKRKDGNKSKGMINVGLSMFPIIKEEKDGKEEEGEKPKKSYNAGILRVTIHQAKDIVAKGSGASKIYNSFMEVTVIQDKALSKSVSNTMAKSSSFGGKLFGNTIGAISHVIPGTANSSQTDLNVSSTSTTTYFHRTKTKKRTNSPIWEETFDIFIRDASQDTLYMVIKDQKEILGQGSSVLGDLFISIMDVMNLDDSHKNDWYKIRNVDSGKVRISFKFDPIDTSVEQENHPVESQFISKLTMYDGRDFPEVDLLGSKLQFALYVKVDGKYVAKFRKTACSNAPVWSEAAYFLLSSKTQSVSLELFKCDPLGGEIFVGSAPVLLSDNVDNESNEERISSVMNGEVKIGDLNFELSIHPAGLDKRAENSDSNAGILSLNLIEADKLFLNTLSASKAKVFAEIWFDDDFVNERMSESSKGNPYSWDEEEKEILVKSDAGNVHIGLRDSEVHENVFLGIFSYPIRNLIQSPLQSHKASLSGSETGIAELTLSLSYRPAELYIEPEVKGDDPGTLEVELVRGIDMVAADAGGTSDPFCLVKINEKKVYKSKVVKKTLNPIWSEVFEIPIKNRKSDVLNIEVRDWNKVNFSQPMGSLSFPLAQLMNDRRDEFTLPLEETEKGSLQMRLLFSPNQLVPSSNSKDNLVTNIASKSLNTVGAGATMVAKAPMNIAKSATKTTKNLLRFGNSKEEDLDQNDSSESISKIEGDYIVACVQGVFDLSESKIDCYVKVKFNGKTMGKTRVLKKTSNEAEWDEEFFPFVPIQALDSAGVGKGILEFILYEKHLLRGDEELQRFSYDLEKHESIVYDQPIWLPFEQADGIKLKITLSKPMPNGSTEMKPTSSDDIGRSSKLFRRKSSHAAK